LSGLSLGAFTKSNRLNRIARLFYRQWFVLVIPYVARDRLPEQQLS